MIGYLEAAIIWFWVVVVAVGLYKMEGWNMRPPLTFFYVVLGLLIGAVVGIGIAKAQHPSQDQAIHDLFYSTWMRPDDRTKSCCGEQDCYPVEARMSDGQWFFKQRHTGIWQPVPQERVETDRDNPDGRNHVCEANGQVYCFIAGSGI